MTTSGDCGGGLSNDRRDSGRPHGAKMGETRPAEVDWSRAISKELHALQTDSALKKSSVFELIDLCKQLYETFLRNAEDDEILQGPTLPPHQRKLPDSAFKSYIRGYVVLAYFINNFVMMHFKGFDVFIESSERDFYLYLQLFLAYNEDLVMAQSDSIILLSIRNATIDYLIKRNLLNYDVDELHGWLVEWVHWARSTGNTMIEPHQRLATKSRLSDATPIRKISCDQFSIDDTIRRFPPLCGIGSPKSSHSTIERLGFKIPNANCAEVGSPDDIYEQRVDASRPISHLVRIEPKNSSNHRHSVPRAATISPYESSHLANDLSFSPPPIPLASAMEVQNYYELSKGHDGRRHGHNENHAAQNERSYQMAQVPGSYSRLQQEYRGSATQQPALSSPRLPVPTMTHYSHNNNSLSSVEYGVAPNVPAHLLPTHQALQSNQLSQPVHSQPRHDQSPYLGPPAASVSAPAIPQSYAQQYSQNNNSYHPAGHGILQPVCGLHNFSATCYINLTMQILFAIPNFEYVFSGLRLGPDSHKRLSDAILNLLQTFKQNSGASVTPSKFIRITSNLKPDFHIPTEQQDAQEFLLFVLQRLHEEMCTKPSATHHSSHEIRMRHRWQLNIPAKDEDEYFKWCQATENTEGVSPVNDMFQGHLQNKLTCNQCGCESITYSPFTILSLPIPRHRNRHNAVDLRACLDYYTQDEVLRGSNAWNCPKCHKQPHVSALDTHPVFSPKKSGIFHLGRKQKQPSVEKHKTKESNIVSTKSLRFVKLPPTLFIHLARFSASLTDKLDVMIEYPSELQMAGNTNARYTLTGVINHYGNLKGGHYTAIANKAIGSHNWFLFDDEVCRANAVPGTVTSSGTLLSRDAYVLCYERV